VEADQPKKETLHLNTLDHRAPLIGHADRGGANRTRKGGPVQIEESGVQKLDQEGGKRSPAKGICMNSQRMNWANYPGSLKTPSAMGEGERRGWRKSKNSKKKV